MDTKNNINLEIGKNEEVVYPFVWINGEKEDVNIKVVLGENASFLLCGIFLGDKDHQIVFNTDVTHKGQYTKSLTTMRGVFFDNAQFNNDGVVSIIKGAKNADGYFQSKILLFDNARGRSVPSLEIDENEVKAGHGSTIGRPDANQLFYLQSRGLTEKQATTLIVSGFFEPIISLLPENRQQDTRKKIKKFLNE
ncbi:MAG TPA: SufD family Fe-S cluster assembly protein [Patescibacteria group bacterium]|nr:SufD family Fe-S cluster assembly protein [Patescibacteria group bacterium]